MSGKISQEKWKSLVKPGSFNVLNNDINTIHYASQLMAIAGRTYGEPADDDSSTALIYDCNKEFLTGVPLGIEKPFTFGLDLTQFSLFVLNDQNERLYNFPMTGKSLLMAFDFISKHLKDAGFDTSILKLSMHYELPGFGFKPEYIFGEISPESHRLHSNLRNNFQVLSHMLTHVFTSVSKILVWPHHFDSGVLIHTGLMHNKQHEGTIGLGLAIADGMINEPYFYVNQWSAKGIKYPKKLPALPAGEWSYGKWKGAYLTLSELIKEKSNEKQFKRAGAFFSSAIETSLKLIS